MFPAVVSGSRAFTAHLADPAGSWHPSVACSVIEARRPAAGFRSTRRHAAWPETASAAVQAAGKRGHVRVGAALPADLDPARDQFFVGAGQAAQIRGLGGARLIPLLGEPDLYAGHLGQQVGTPARHLAELGHSGSFLLGGQRVPLRVPARGAAELRDEDPVRVTTTFAHVF